MKKIFTCTMLFLFCLFFIGCDSIPQEQIETVLDSLQNAEIGKVYEGTYDQFKNINVESSYLGYGYDIINDEYIKKDCINLSAPIIDLAKLDEVKLKLIKENNAETIEVEADTMEDFVEKYNVATKVNGKVGVLFSGGLSVDYKSDSEVKTYTHYYKKILDVKTFNLYLTNSLSEIRNLLTEEFKDDLMNLHPESLFDKYGTHMLKEVSMGGRIEVSSQYSSIKSGASASVEAAVDAHVKQLKGGEVNAELLTTAEANLQKENIQYYYNVKQIGGALTNINSISSLNDKYDEWLKSFDDNAEYSALSGIVGENSLIALWDLLPAEETARREALYEAFKQLSGDAFDKLCEDFKINTKRTLNVAIDGPGTIDSYDYKYEDGDEVILKATSNDNARFIGWYSGDQLVSNNPIYAFNIHVNTILIAKFKELTDDSCILSINISGQGEVKGNNGDVYKEGESIMLEAKPYYGNEFVGWYVNNELVSTNDFYSFNIKEDTTIVAKFTDNKVEKYQLIVNKLGKGNGTVNYNPEYDPKSVAVVTATPDEYSYFVGWFEDDILISNNPEYKFIIKDDTILYAKFEIIEEEEYTVSLTIYPENRGNVYGNKTSFKLKELVTLEAVPAQGYEFKQFVIDGQNITANPYSFNISKNMSIIVVFEEKAVQEYTLTYNLNETDFKVSAQIEEENLIVSEDEIPRFAVPASTYLIFKGWYIEDTQISDENGKVIHNVNNYTTSRGKWIGGNATIYARWEYNPEYTFISTPAEFSNIRNNSEGKYVLLENIDFSNNSISPINSFSGVLDGNGKTISNWKYHPTAVADCGIFVTNNGEIKNLNISNCSLEFVEKDKYGRINMAILCANNNGDIHDVMVDNCIMTVKLGDRDINEDSYVFVGIVCGKNTKKISNVTITICLINAYAGTQYKGARVEVGMLTGNGTGGEISNIISKDNKIGTDECKASANDCKVWEWKEVKYKHYHGRPHGFAGEVIGYAENTRIFGYIRCNNNLVNLDVRRDCDCEKNSDNGYDKYVGGYIGKAENCVIDIN